MTDIISDARLAEIRAGLEGVTPGPWEAVEDECAECRKLGKSEAFISGLPGGYHAPFDNLTDAEHIARLDPQTVLALLSRLDKAEALMLDLRAYIVTHDDISMHSKAVALSDRVTNHFPPPPES